MYWEIYTKKIADDGGVQIRWFWRKPVLEGREESAFGFMSRAECEADARKHGYTGDAPEERRFGE